MGRWEVCVSRGVCMALTLGVLLLLGADRAEAGCGGCMNGGKLLLPNNIFGVCRCKCQKSYKGPLCQISVKRSEAIGEGYGSEEEEYGEHAADPRAALVDMLKRRFLDRRPTEDELRQWLDQQ